MCERICHKKIGEPFSMYSGLFFAVLHQNLKRSKSTLWMMFDFFFAKFGYFYNSRNHDGTQFLNTINNSFILLFTIQHISTKNTCRVSIFHVLGLYTPAILQIWSILWPWGIRHCLQSASSMVQPQVIPIILRHILVNNALYDIELVSRLLNLVKPLYLYDTPTV